MEGFPLVLMHSLLFPSMNDQGSGKWDCERLYAQMIMSQISNAWDFLALLGWLKGSHQLWGVGVVNHNGIRTRALTASKAFQKGDVVLASSPAHVLHRQDVHGRLVGPKHRMFWWVWEFYSAIVIWCYLQRGPLRRRMFYLCFFLRLFRWYIAYNVVDIKWGFFLLPARIHWDYTWTVLEDLAYTDTTLRAL